MRGMLEDEMSAKRAAKLKEIQQENKRLALEKKQREAKWRENQESLNQNEITDPNLTVWRDVWGSEGRIYNLTDWLKQMED